ncbi:MAG TPA: MFS transporter [Rhodopila sp.]|uniref:MFS transporter n=1 Tax=Rhodopila sp. TaxID=2480087 RepID=UPI002CCB8586|nr:MFS transporter [Rhodopila sp.]HVY16019.1 MFS transporter [Rhodopila sp.]
MTASAIQDIEKASASRSWWTFGVLMTAQFMYVMDAFIVNVALPAIRTDLSATPSEIQGVIVLYLITMATLVITGGRLGDIYGTRLVFLAGLAGFTVASLLCGLAVSGGTLVIARAAQGTSAALMVPQVLATTHRLFQGADRGRAFGIYGVVLGVGAAVGMTLGGCLVVLNIAGLGWRSIFVINVPIGIGLIAATLRLAPHIPRRPDVRLDAAGAATLFLALLCLLGPILVGQELEWPRWLFAVMGIGFLFLVLFWAVEAKIAHGGGLPLIQVDMLKRRPTALPFLAVLFFSFANIAFYFVITQYMQLGLRYSPLETGAAVLPLVLAFSVVSRLAGPRAQRSGPRAMIEGCAVQAGGLALIALIVGMEAAPGPAAFAALLVPFGAGQGMVLAPLSSLALSKVHADHAGSGAGTLSTVQQIGNATGVALVGALYFAMQAHHSDRIAMLAALGALAVAVIAAACSLGLSFESTELRPPRVADMAIREDSPLVNDEGCSYGAGSPSA